MTKKEQIAKGDFIISLATMLSDNKEDVRNSVIESIAKTNAQFVYMHPIDNIDLKLYYTQFVKYEVGSEEGICALLLNTFVKECDEKTKNYIKELDIGYISAETFAGEEEFEEIYKLSLQGKEKILIVGDELKEHKNIKNIVKILALIKKFTDFKLVVLSKYLERKINSCLDFELEEINEIVSFNGALVHKIIDNNEADDKLIVSETFANIVKVSDGDEVYVITKDEKFKKIVKLDNRLLGTISIIKEKVNSEILLGYRYKQVKIQKVQDFEEEVFN